MRQKVAAGRGLRWGAVSLLSAGLFALTLFVLLLGAYAVLTDAGQYDRLQAELDVYDSVGVAREELAPLMEDMAAYLKGEKPDLDRRVTMFGQQAPAFNEREQAHMRDVRALFDGGRKLLLAAGLLGVLLCAFAFFLARGRAPGTLRRACLGALLIWLALAAALWMLFANGFAGAFNRFHELLFDNDLWQLDPATDAMIRMFPQAFFERLAWAALRGGLLALGAALLAALAVKGAALALRLRGKIG